MKKHGVAFQRTLFCLTLFFSVNALAGSSVPFTIVKISVKDKKAAVRLTDGTMKLLSQGDLVLTESGQSLRLRVIEIAQDRIVLEEEAGQAKDRIVVRLVKGKQSVERISKIAKQGPLPNSIAIGQGLPHEVR